MKPQVESRQPRALKSPQRHRRLFGCVIAVLSALSVLLMASLHWRGSPSIDTFVRDGREALAKRDFAAAMQLAEVALAREPDSAEANLLASRSATGLGRYSQALEHLSRVHDGDSEAAILARCDAGDLLLLHFARLSEAEIQFRRVLAHDPRNLTANERLASVLGLASRSWELIPYRLTVIELDHIEPLHLYVLCLGDRALQNDHLIHEYHRQVPNDPAPLLALSRLAFEKQDYTSAENLARSAISIKPDLVEGYVKVGRVLLQTGADDALDAWQESLPSTADDHPEIWALRAAWAQRRSLERVAIRCYWETVRRDANHQGANYQLGRRLAAMGRREDAERFLERATRLQEYLNIVKVAVSGNKAHELRAAARSAERLGLVWESYGWYRLSLKIDPQVSEIEWKCRQLRAQFLNDKSPRTRNVASVNPALRVDLSSFPLPRRGMRGTRHSHEPDVTTTASPTFKNQASTAGLSFHYFNGGEPTENIRTMYEFTGGGVGVLDFDGDGWPDLYLTQGCRWPPDVDQDEHLDRLFRNLGNGKFDDVTEHAGLDENGFGQGVTVGDFDNDGFCDVYVSNIGGNRLFHNNGDGTFSDVTEEAGVAGDHWTSSCVFADLNGDALPDLYAVNYLGGEDVFTIDSMDEVTGGGSFMPQCFPSAQDRLYQNLGDGTFADVTSTSGIEIAGGKGLGIVAADFDSNGRIDLFVANDSVSNFFFRSQNKPGEALRLVEEGLLSGLAVNSLGNAEACMGVAVDDVDESGRLDLYITNFFQESNTLYVQDEIGLFADATQQAGLRDPSIYSLGFGTQFIDAELDGWPDLIVTNGHVANFSSAGAPYRMPPQYYRNVGHGRFEEMEGSKLGQYFERAYVGRPVARLDWNKDGREDVVIGHLDAPVALLTNTTQPVGHSLAVNLRGTQTARDAVGAIVRVSVGGRDRTRQLTAGDGYLASNERRLVFGLGAVDRVESLTVRWLSGREQQFVDLAADAEYVLVEGRKEPVRLSPPKW